MTKHTLYVRKGCVEVLVTREKVHQNGMLVRAKARMMVIDEPPEQKPPMEISCGSNEAVNDVTLTL